MDTEFKKYSQKYNMKSVFEDLDNDLEIETPEQNNNEWKDALCQVFLTLTLVAMTPYFLHLLFD